MKIFTMKNILLNLIFCLVVAPIFAQQLQTIVIEDGPCNAEYSFDVEGSNFVLGAGNAMDSSVCSFTAQETLNLQAQNQLIITSPNGDETTTLNGLSTLDMVRLQQGILFGFNSVREIIAGDWDRDGAISTYDLLYMRRFILGLESEVDYQLYYVNANLFLLQELDPFDMSGYDFTKLTFSDSDVVDGVLPVDVIKIGDLNNSATLDGEEIINSRSEIRLEFENLTLEAGQGYDVNFSIAHDEKISGFLFKLKSDQVELLNVNSDYNADEFMWNADEGDLAVSYLNQNPSERIEFTINLNAFESGRLSDFITLDANYHAEIVDDKLNASAITLESVISNNEELSTTVSNVYPNPVSEALNISFGNDGMKHVSLIDITGKPLYNMSTNSEVLTMDIPNNICAGLYLIKVESNNKSETFRIIVE